MVQNNLESIAKEIHHWIIEFTPVTTSIDVEMEIIHILADRLYEVCKDEKEIKKALMNMFLAGQIFNNK